MKQKNKCLILLSGGLDSLVACKVMQEQTEVHAVHFILPFNKNSSERITTFCEKQGIKLHFIDLTSGKLFDEYMAMIRHPKHGRGTALNPCIDCHMFMMRKARVLASSLGIEVLATGEVLGERPLSQTKRALILINNKLGFEVLRPLSAKLLDETSWEKNKIINRDKLLDIMGRNRKIQMDLAKQYNINYPTPGGGCLLCEKKYCEKLKPILDKLITFKDIQLLGIGRHFSGIILGRDEQENLLLIKEQGIKIIPQDNPGPTALVKDKKLVENAKELINQYAKKEIKEFKILD